MHQKAAEATADDSESQYRESENENDENAAAYQQAIDASADEQKSDRDCAASRLMNVTHEYPCKEPSLACWTAGETENDAHEHWNWR